MPNYRRLKTPGATYFFTVATYERQKILCEPLSRKALKGAVEEVRRILPFRIEAWVVLPDHLHCIWTLPKGDSDYSKRWGLIKSNFTKKIKNVREDIFKSKLASPSRKKHRESVIWQRRFWEHQIRNQEDFNRHCNYIHYNPVKHGFVDDPAKWQQSTIHRFIQKGLYSKNWGASVENDVLKMEME